MVRSRSKGSGGLGELTTTRADYREWLRLATAENKADAASKKVMTDHVAEIEAIVSSS